MNDRNRNDELHNLSYEAERIGDQAVARVWKPGEGKITEGYGRTIKEALADALRKRQRLDGTISLWETEP